MSPLRYLTLREFASRTCEAFSLREAERWVDENGPAPDGWFNDVPIPDDQIPYRYWPHIREELVEWLDVFAETVESWGYDGDGELSTVVYRGPELEHSDYPPHSKENVEALAIEFSARVDQRLEY